MFMFWSLINSDYIQSNLYLAGFLVRNWLVTAYLRPLHSLFYNTHLYVYDDCTSIVSISQSRLITCYGGDTLGE